MLAYESRVSGAACGYVHRPRKYDSEMNIYERSGGQRKPYEERRGRERGQQRAASHANLSYIPHLRAISQSDLSALRTAGSVSSLLQAQGPANSKMPREPWRKPMVAKQQQQQQQQKEPWRKPMVAGRKDLVKKAAVLSYNNNDDSGRGSSSSSTCSSGRSTAQKVVHKKRLRSDEERLMEEGGPDSTGKPMRDITNQLTDVAVKVSNIALNKEVPPRRSWKGIAHRKTSIAIYRQKLSQKMQETVAVDKYEVKEHTQAPASEPRKMSFSRLRKFASNLDLRPRRWKSTPNIKSTELVEDEKVSKAVSRRNHSHPSATHESAEDEFYGLREYDPYKHLGVKKREKRGSYHGNDRPASLIVDSTVSCQSVTPPGRPKSLDFDRLLESCATVEKGTSAHVAPPRSSSSSWNIFKLLKQKNRLDSIEELGSTFALGQSDADGDAECHLDYSFSPPILWFPPPPVTSPAEERLV